MFPDASGGDGIDDGTADHGFPPSTDARANRPQRPGACARPMQTRFRTRPTPPRTQASPLALGRKARPDSASRSWVTTFQLLEGGLYVAEVDGCRCSHGAP